MPAHPLLAGIKGQRQHLLNTYYDTPALDLHDRRIAVRFRQKGWQWLLTVKSAEPATGGLAMRSEWETAAQPGQFDFRHVDDPELKVLLGNATPQLQPIFTTDFRRTTWHVPYGESVIEMAVDRGSIESQRRKTPICEIELELISGRIRDIFGLTRQLQNTLDLRPAIASKAERGYAVFADSPECPFRAKPATLSPELTPVEAFRNIALGCLEHFQRNGRGPIASTDPEYAHQARVALRSAIKLFAPVLPADFVATYGQTWQTLATALCEARNWDAFVSETLPPILAAFPKHRDASRLAARHRELEPAERHRMRICFKKLRYAIEFFAPLLPAKPLKRYLSALTRLQDELGLINDHVTAQALIDEALHGRPPGPIHGWMTGRHALLVSELPEALDDWLNQKAPWK